jgi:hypothetical protein
VDFVSFNDVIFRVLSMNALLSGGTSLRIAVHAFFELHSDA